MTGSEPVKTTSSLSLIFFTSTSPRKRFSSPETIILTLNIQRFPYLFSSYTWKALGTCSSSIEVVSRSHSVYRSARYGARGEIMDSQWLCHGVFWIYGDARRAAPNGGTSCNEVLSAATPMLLLASSYASPGILNKRRKAEVPSNNRMKSDRHFLEMRVKTRPGIWLPLETSDAKPTGRKSASNWEYTDFW